MKLKTLKDIKIDIKSKKVLEEVVKEWIKRLESDHPYENEDPLLSMDQYVKGQIDWINQFFNLNKKNK